MDLAPTRVFETGDTFVSHVEAHLLLSMRRRIIYHETWQHLLEPTCFGDYLSMLRFSVIRAVFPCKMYLWSYLLK